MWTSLTTEGVEVLGVGVYRCLQRWTALQLAIHNEWGGPSSVVKCQQFHSDILAFFISSKEQRYIDELEDLLDDSMLELFNTEIEDGSLFEVAEQIMTMHEECMLGNFENVRQMSTASDSGRGILESEELPTPDDEFRSSASNSQVGISGVEVEGMDMEDSLPVAVPASTSRMPQMPKLTEEEVADGWQHAPVRKGWRSKT